MRIVAATCSHVPGKGEQMVIMVTIEMWGAENGKKQMPMIRFPVSGNLKSQIWHFEKNWAQFIRLEG